MALGNVTFGGLASGLPPDMVDQLMQSQQTRLKAYNRDKDFFTGQQAAYSDLKSKLTDLSAKAEALQDVTSWAPHTTSSSDEDKITATATNTATAAIHTVYVGQLATNDTFVMDTGVTSSTDTLDNASNFTFVYNGTMYGTSATDGAGSAPTTGFLSTDLSGQTLSDVASAINGITYGDGDGDGEDDPGVSASVLYDGSKYRLVLTAKDSGQNSGASRLAIDGDTTMTFAAEGGPFTAFTNTVVAQNALFRVDGVNVSSTSNQPDNTLTGVTINLKSVTTGTGLDAGAVDPANLGTPVTVTVANDTATLKSTLDSFTSAYNDVVDFVNKNKTGALSASSLARGVVSQLRSVLNNSTHKADGSGDALSPYSILAEMGLRTDQKTGKISFDGTSLDDAITNDFNVLTSLFTNTQSDVGDDYNAGLAYRFEDLIDGLTNSTSGSFTGQEKGLQARIDRLEDSIERENVRLEKVRERLTLKFANLEQMVSQMNSAAGSLTSTLSKL